MSDQSEKSITLPDSTNEGSLTTNTPERRSEVRYPFIATAEVIELRSQTRVTGRCSDLSEGGCYIDTLAPFAADSAVRIIIQHDSREFQANAVVAYTHSSMGMGIKFMQMKHEFRNVLRYWIAELTGAPIPELIPAEAPPYSVHSDDSDSNFRLVLNELITFLVQKKIITEMEGAELLIRAFR
jgi:hypothetical protein